MYVPSVFDRTSRAAAIDTGITKECLRCVCDEIGAESFLGLVAEQLRLVESFGADRGQRYEQDHRGDRSNSTFR